MPTLPPALQEFEARRGDPAVQAVIVFITTILGSALAEVASWSIQAGKARERQFWLHFTDGVRSIEGYLYIKNGGGYYVRAFRTGFILTSDVEAIRFKVTLKEKPV
ncbi:MAG TPA: hypothetical protein VNE38_05200 [Ktedonobacteraceae bacterium]|nr:hypothetical protein [Ktedonobacteraceae bacterium]